jgi:L-malate glycosyltransferase
VSVGTVAGLAADASVGTDAADPPGVVSVVAAPAGTAPSPAPAAIATTAAAAATANGAAATAARRQRPALLLLRKWLMGPQPIDRRPPIGATAPTWQRGAWAPGGSLARRDHPGTLPAVRVDQVIPSLASRDAIGVHTLTLTNALRAVGIDSDIFYGNATPDVAELGRPVVELGRATRDRWLLYQSSIGSPVFDILAARTEPKLVNYHNITPAPLLAPWEPNVGYEVALGRTQLARLAAESRLAVADSTFNETELRDAGYTNTAVVPLLIDMTATGADPDPELAGQLAAAKERGGADLLFVGKISPHKAPHDLVKMLAVYRRLYDPSARLWLVGSPLGDKYGPALAGFVHDLGLDDAVTVTGSVTAADLEAYYQAADAFVCASDHEGFCVPLVEAMGHRVPVVANGVAAIPETVGRAGIVLPDKNPLRFAAAVHRVVTDDELRGRIAAAAADRVAAFSVTRSTDRFVELVRDAVGA